MVVDTADLGSLAVVLGMEVGTVAGSLMVVLDIVAHGLVVEGVACQERLH